MSQQPFSTFDALIIGGGPAGLSAALVLGRCCRRVVVIDAGRGRNARANHMHNYLTRDGVPPAAFRTLAHEDLRPYGVEWCHNTAAKAERHAAGFAVTLDSGRVFHSRKLLLATGVQDHLPKVPGFDEFYGASIHHCPYCDAWEHRDRPMAALGRGSAALGLALSLRTWTPDVTACCEGEALSDHDRGRAERNGIRIRTEPVARLEGEGGRLRRVHFESGPPTEVEALFFNTGQRQTSPIAAQLGCEFKEDGGVACSDRQCTNVPGLYIAGDAEKEVQFVIVAAAEGAVAATAINRELQDEDRGESKQKR